MKILVVSQYFYPENFRINQLCLDLKNRGHDITVLTGKPNYPKGEYYNGYTFNGDESEVWNDIPIIRVPLRARGKSSKELIRNYLSFVYNANKKVRTLTNNFDVIYVFEVSPITVALPAIKLKKKLNIPLVMNVQDLWPENIVAVTGIRNKFIIGCINVMVNYIYKHCDLILAASPAFIDKIKKHTKDKNKIIYWPQYSTVKKEDLGSLKLDSKKINIMFTGNIGEAQGIDIAIETANKLKDDIFCWHFVGDGRQKEKMQYLVENYQLKEHVIFYDAIPENLIPGYLASADAGLLILKPDPVFDMTIPAKLQTYLACGVPIIGCVEGEAKKVIEESKAGLVSNTISPAGLLDVCLRFKETDKNELLMMRKNALKYSETVFDKDKLIEKLEKVMEELCQTSKIKH